MKTICCGNGQQLQWSQEAAPPLNTSGLQARIQVSLHLESKTSKTCTNGPQLAVPLPWSLLLLDHIYWRKLKGSVTMAQLVAVWHSFCCLLAAFGHSWWNLVKTSHSSWSSQSPKQLWKRVSTEKPHNSHIYFRNSLSSSVNVENF